MSVIVQQAARCVSALVPALLAGGLLSLLIRHRPTATPQSTLHTAVTLTRLALLANAATLLLALEGLLGFLSYGLAQGWAHSANTLATVCTFGPNPLAGAALVACAIALVRRQRLWLRWLWLAISVDLARWVLLITTGYFSIQANITAWVSPASAITSWLKSTVYVGPSVPLSIVLLWYWRRSLWRRQRMVELQPQHAVCAHCGYCLTGNISGRCPECGQPSAD